MQPRLLILSLHLWLAPSAQAGFSEVSRHELASMVADIAPVVGEVAGRSFHEVPDVVLADEAILAEVVLRERLHLLATVEGLSPEEVAEQAQVLASQQLALGFEGKYGFVDDRLYISVDRVIQTLMRNRAEPRLLRPVLRVIIAHELAHALQDQHTEMDRLLREARSDDAVMALNCTFEGHAVWVQEAVAARLGLEEAASVMRDWMGYEAPIDTGMTPERFYSRYVYGLGRGFVAHHAKSGADAVWAVLLAPPRTTGEIVWPERYPQPAMAVPGAVGSALGWAARRLGQRGWTVRTATLGDYDLREQLLRAGAAMSPAEGLLVGWSMSTVGPRDEGAQVQVLRFQSASQALGFVEESKRRAAAHAQRAAGLPFLDVSVTEITGVPGDLAVQFTSTFQLDEDRAEGQAVQWVLRGSDVVQVLTVNHEPRRRRVPQVYRRVFRALAVR